MTGNWTREIVGGKPADVYQPPGRARFGVLFLHPVGLETLSGNEAYTSLFAELGLACVCPHTGVSWWADRTCPTLGPVTAEQHVLANVVPFFAERWGIHTPGIALLGI